MMTKYHRKSTVLYICSLCLIIYILIYLKFQRYFMKLKSIHFIQDMKKSFTLSFLCSDEKRRIKTASNSVIINFLKFKCHLSPAFVWLFAILQDKNVNIRVNMNTKRGSVTVLFGLPHYVSNQTTELLLERPENIEPRPTSPNKNADTNQKAHNSVNRIQSHRRENKQYPRYGYFGEMETCSSRLDPVTT